MDWKDVTKLQKRELIIKAVSELYDTVEEDGVSTITLNLNFNPYNWGHKLNVDYQIGYPTENENTNEPISQRVYDISR
jgi:hypothetical protein